MLKDEGYLLALDIGTRAVKGIIGRSTEEGFKVLFEKNVEHKERAMLDGQIHDIEKVAEAVLEIKNYMEEKLGQKVTESAIAAAGRALKTVTTKGKLLLEENKIITKEMLKSLELEAVAIGEEKVNGNHKGRLFSVGYTVKSYYVNDYIISNPIGHRAEKLEAEVIATFLPKSVVDSLYAVMEMAGLKVLNMTLEPIAAMEAVVPKKLRLLNIALVDIGAGTSDIAICSKSSIKAYGMVPLAGDEITEALAEQLLVDFLTAEEIKKKIAVEDIISYVDVLGNVSQCKASELAELLMPTVESLGRKIAEYIIDLNGGAAPGAVFLVGGGAYTANIVPIIAKNLKLPLNRIAIKDRKAVENCTFEDYSSGSIGVTVLGIALTALKGIGDNFLKVYFNDNIVSIFNTGHNTLKDALIASGVNSRLLINRNGKNLRFSLNGEQRLAFGKLGEAAKMFINGQEATIDTVLKGGDKITFLPAKNGEDASPKVSDYILNIDSKRITLEGEDIYLDPQVYVNGNRESANCLIKNEDQVEVRYIVTLGDLIKFCGYEYEKALPWVNGNSCETDYILTEGDIISFKSSTTIDKDHNIKEETNNNLKVQVNGKDYILKGKQSYVFIDIFDYIDFNLKEPKGHIILEINGRIAGYYDELKENDVIKVYWKS